MTRSMMTGMFFSGYICVAFLLYLREQKLIQNMMQYAQEKSPVGNGEAAIYLLVTVLVLPIQTLIGFVWGVFSLVSPGGSEKQGETYDEDTKDFLERYYPEELWDLQTMKPVEIHRDQMSEFLDRVDRALDHGLGDWQIRRFMYAVEGFRDDREAEKLIFSLRTEGGMRRMVVDLEWNGRKDRYRLGFHLPPEMTREFMLKMTVPEQSLMKETL